MEDSVYNTVWSWGFLWGRGGNSLEYLPLCNIRKRDLISVFGSPDILEVWFWGCREEGCLQESCLVLCLYVLNVCCWVFQYRGRCRCYFPPVVALGLPLWVPFIIAAASAGVASIIVRPISGLSFVGGTKWYGCRASYAAFTLLNSTFRTGHRLFHASCAPLHTAHFLMADLSTLVGQSFELCGSAQ